MCLLKINKLQLWPVLQLIDTSFTQFALIAQLQGGSNIKQ